jgi:zinc transport system substrate-binding protein
VEDRRVRRSLLLGLLLVAACSGTGLPEEGKVQVVVGAYPFAWVAEQVGGPDVTVTDLVPPGAEPHDLELTPKQVGQVEEADVVLHLTGFQPAVDDAVKGNGLDLGPVADQEGGDPHVWLDPARMQAIATAVGEALAEDDSEHAPAYRQRAEALVSRLKALDATFRGELTGCARTDLVTSHSAFGYLASRYGLTQVGITGISPEEEPSPKKLAEVARFAKEHDVTTIFFETLVSPKVAETVADEVGATTAVLDPLEGVTGDDDYVSVQERNAQALHAALGCR